MATTVKKKPETDKSEMLKDLTAGYAKWVQKGNKEYADAYEHMICALTTPPKTV